MAFGEILKQKRLELGWTKEYVSERTRLMGRVIDDLEAENCRRIPSQVYGRGFLRLYCDLLKLDPQPLIDDYMQKTSGGRSMPVSRPAVHDLPAKPLEPIHTGGRRTMPPPKIEEEKPITHHKYVHPAEETFTSVPKPQVMVPAEEKKLPPPPPVPMQSPSQPPVAEPKPVPAPEPAPAPVADPPAFKLEGDVLPFTPPPAPATPAAPADTMIPPVNRDAVRETLFARTKERPHREVTPVREPREMLRTEHAPRSSIFGPQHPVPEPPNPQLGSIRAAVNKTVTSVQKVFHSATHPKVERMDSQKAEPLFTRRTIIRSLTIFGVLMLMTVGVLAFRYVFQMSADAEIEVPITTATAKEPFKLRPVADPPAPYFP